MLASTIRTNEMEALWRYLTLVGWVGLGPGTTTVLAAVPVSTPVNSYCQRCDRDFVSSRAYKQHLASSAMHFAFCDSCDRAFKTRAALKQHYLDSSKHPYCQQCDMHFPDGSALEVHYLSCHCFCVLCRQFFDSEDDLDGHNCQRRWYCIGCMRFFDQECHLSTHLRASKLHNELTIACPGRRCTKAFVSYSDLTLHLESGACRSKVNRATINNLAVRIEPRGVITNPTRLLAGPSGDFSVPRPIRTYATAQSFNGTAYECILCHRTFVTLPRLDAHLNSPAHDEEIYHCPTAYDGCGAEFKTLSGLLQHMESECCDVRKFRNQVTKTLDVLTAQMGRIGL